MAKIILILVFGILLVLTIISASSVYAAECGGAVQCNCGDTVTSNYTMLYNLNNCPGNGLVIGANGITLDCNGYLIDGIIQSETSGIYINNRNKITIKNCNIREFYYGIFLYSSSNNQLTNITTNSNNYGIALSYLSSNNIFKTITANSNTFLGIYLGPSSNNNQLTNITASNNAPYGIWLSSSSNNQLMNIIANGNSAGILGSSSNNNQLTNIIANSNYEGIRFDYSSNNTILNSTLSENTNFDFYIIVSNDAHCNNRLINVIGSDNKAVAYYNSSSSISGQEFSELILCNADYSSLNNIIISASTSKKNNGLLVLRTDNSNFSNINSIHNMYGIRLVSSSNNTLTNITANYNINFGGIYLSSSPNNQLTNIEANVNYYGIALQSSSSNILTNITAHNNAQYGIYLSSSPNNILTNIGASANVQYGIYLNLNSNNNILTKITAKSNYAGISLDYSSNNNTLLSNIFCLNSYDIYDADSNFGDENTCDTTYNWNDIGTKGCTYICFLLPQPSCSDGIKNQDETDIDCGGVCLGCIDGKNCVQDSDCQSKYCKGGLCLSCPIKNLTADPFEYEGNYVFNESRLSNKEKALLPYVYKYSKEYKISPALIMAIIKKESNFNNNSLWGDNYRSGSYCKLLHKEKLYKNQACEFLSYGYMQLKFSAAFDADFRGINYNFSSPLDYKWWYEWFEERYFCVGSTDCEKKFSIVYGNDISKMQNLEELYLWFKKWDKSSSVFKCYDEIDCQAKFSAYIDWPREGIDADVNVHYGSAYIQKQYNLFKDSKVYNKDSLKNTISAYNAGNPTQENKKDYVVPVLSYYEDYKNKTMC